MAERIGEEKARIANHLDAVSGALELITSGIEEFEICERLVAARPRATCPALVESLNEPSGETCWKS
jgi:hypothetical protein